MIRDYGRSKEIAEHFEQVIPEIATQSSNRERRAIEAEREVEAMKRLSIWKNTWVKSMMQLYQVLSPGLFVELPNTVEGLIHITNLPEFYHFNERDLTLRGENQVSLSEWVSRSVSVLKERIK